MIPSLQTQLIRFGHSPDPDDAFMFYALAKEAIPMRGFRVEHVIEDIESLNQRALAFCSHCEAISDLSAGQAGIASSAGGSSPRNDGALEVTAVSCHAYAYLADKYVIMSSGASVGDNYGPILVARPSVIASPAKQGEAISDLPAGQAGIASSTFGRSPRNDGSLNIRGKRIAIPGKLTTAYLTLQLYERDFEPVFIPFDQIFAAVESGQADLGLIIHEGQITYPDQGMEKVLDLGVWWREKTGLPLPLGLDVIRRDLGEETIRNFSAVFKESIQYALDHRKPALDYALQYGRGIREDLNDRFVGMYVNGDTVEMSSQVKQGLSRLYEEGFQKGILPHRVNPEFAG